MWPTIESKPKTSFNTFLDAEAKAYHEDTDVYSFLSFLKLLPTHKATFETAVNALIQFCDVSARCPRFLANKFNYFF